MFVVWHNEVGFIAGFRGSDTAVYTTAAQITDDRVLKSVPTIAGECAMISQS